MSKNIIFYFSGTGNSLKVAKDVAAAIEDRGRYHHPDVTLADMIKKDAINMKSAADGCQGSRRKGCIAMNPLSLENSVLYHIGSKKKEL